MTMMVRAVMAMTTLTHPVTATGRVRAAAHVVVRRAPVPVRAPAVDKGPERGAELEAMARIKAASQKARRRGLDDRSSHTSRHTLMTKYLIQTG
jgi:hypothetical protein